MHSRLATLGSFHPTYFSYHLYSNTFIQINSLLYNTTTMHISMLTISHEFLHTFVPKGGFEPPIYLLLPISERISFQSITRTLFSNKTLFLLSTRLDTTITCKIIQLNACRSIFVLPCMFPHYHRNHLVLGLL